MKDKRLLRTFGLLVLKSSKFNQMSLRQLK